MVAQNMPWIVPNENAVAFMGTSIQFNLTKRVAYSLARSEGFARDRLVSIPSLT